MDAQDKDRRFNFNLRLTALVTALFFSWNTIAFSDGSGIFLSIVSRSRQGVAGGDDSSLNSNDILQSIKLPSELGQVKRAFRGSGKRTVIHIQDAHVNEEAQRNIAGIMDYFFKEHQVRLVNVEGASGELAHHLLSAFPDTNARSLLADYFLREARITGPEYLALSKRPELILYGIEETGLYDANRKAFLSALEFKQRDEVILKQLRQIMESASRYVLSENLWDLIRQKQRFQKEETDFVTYVRYLKSLADKQQVQEPFPQISAFMSLLESQSRVDLEKTEAEVDLAVKKLKEVLSGEDLLLFIKNTGEFQSSKLTRENYYRYLGTLLPKAGAAASFEHLGQYLEHMRLSESIGIEIFDEIKKLEDLLKEKMIRNEEERTFDRLFHFLEIYEKIFDFALTKEDAEFFYGNRDQFHSSAFSRFLMPLLEKYHFDQEIKNLSLTPLDEDLPKIESFYELAMKRDEILIANALKKMEEEKQEISVIVTGGFHTSGLEKRLQALGFSYVVVTPRIAKAMNEAKESERYAKAMQSEPTRLAALLSEAYFPQISGRANDPRYQLGTPSGFSTYEELARAFSRPETRDFNPRMLVREFPALDLTFTGAVLLTAIFAALGKEFQGVEGKISSDMLNKILGAMSPYLKDEEKPWAPLLYMPLLAGTRQGAAAAGSLVSEGFGDGASLTAVWNSKKTQAEVSTLKPGAVFEINGLLLEIRLQERGLAIDLSERKATGMGETEGLAPIAPAAHPFQVLIHDPALEEKIRYEVLNTLSPVERQGRLLAWTLAALALHYKEIKSEAIKQGMYQGLLKRAVEDSYTLAQIGAATDPKNAASLTRYLGTSFRFSETLPEGGQKISAEHYREAYRNLFDQEGALAENIAEIPETIQEVLSLSLARGTGAMDPRILSRARSELRRPAAEKKAVPRFKFEDLFSNEADEADAQIFSHGELARNIARVFERAGIDLSSTISRRAYWLTSEGNKVDRLAEGETAEKRVYKLIADTNEGKKNFILEINGFQTGLLKAKFRSYSAELNQLDEAIRNSVDQEGNPAGIQKILGKEISPYAKVVVSRKGLGQPADTKIYDMKVEKETEGVRTAVKAMAEEEPLTSLLSEEQKEGYSQEILYKTKIAGASHALGVYSPQAPVVENLPVEEQVDSSITFAPPQEVFSPEISLPAPAVEPVQVVEEQAALERKAREEEALRQLETQRDQIQAAVKKASDDLNELAARFETTSQTLAKRETEIKKADDQLGVLRQNGLELDRQIEQKRQDFETLNREMTAAQLEADAQAARALENARTELASLENSKRLLNAGIEQLGNRQHVLGQTVKAMGQRAAGFRKTQAALKDQNRKLSETKLQTEQEILAARAQAAKATEELNRLKAEITSFTQRKDQQEKLLNRGITELEQKTAAARESYEKLVSDGQALERQIQESRRQFTIEKEKLAAVTGERQEAEAQVTRARTDFSRLLSQITEARSATADLDSQQKRYLTLISQIETRDRDLTQLNEKIAAEGRKLETLHNTVDTATKTGAALSEQIRQQEATVTGLETTQNTLVTQIDQLTQTKTQIDTEMASARQSTEQMKQTLAQTEKTLQARHEELEAIEGKIKDGLTLSQQESARLAAIQETITELAGTIPDLTARKSQADSLSRRINELQLQVQTLDGQKATLEKSVQELVRGGVRRMRELYRAGLGEEMKQILRIAPRDLRPDDLKKASDIMEEKNEVRSEIRMELDPDEEDAADVLKGILAEQEEDDRIFRRIQQNYKEGIQLRIQDDLENLLTEIAGLTTLEGFDLESRVRNISQKYVQEIEQVRELEIYEELVPALRDAVDFGTQKAAAAYEKRTRLFAKENRVAELQLELQALAEDKTPGRAAVNLSEAAALQNQILEIHQSLAADETSSLIQEVLAAAPQKINALLQSYQKDLAVRVQGKFRVLRKMVVDLKTVEGFDFEQETAKIRQTFTQEINQFSAFEFSRELVQAFTQAVEKASEEVRIYFLLRELESGFEKELGNISRNIGGMSRTDRYGSFQADLENAKNGFSGKITVIRSRPGVNEDIEAHLDFLNEQIEEAEKDLKETYARRQELFQKEEAIEALYVEMEQLENIEGTALRPENLIAAANFRNQILQLDETLRPDEGTEATLRMVENISDKNQAIERRYLAGLRNRLDESVEALANEVETKDVKDIQLRKSIETLFGPLTEEVKVLKGTAIYTNANQMVTGTLKKEVGDIRQQFNAKRIQMITPQEAPPAPQELPVKIEPVKAPVIPEVQVPLPVSAPLPVEIKPEVSAPEVPPQVVIKQEPPAKMPKAKEVPTRKPRVPLRVEGLEDRTVPSGTSIFQDFEKLNLPAGRSPVGETEIVWQAPEPEGIVQLNQGLQSTALPPVDPAAFDAYFEALGQQDAGAPVFYPGYTDPYAQALVSLESELAIPASALASILNVSTTQELIVKNANGETIAFAALEYDANTGQTTFKAFDPSQKKLAEIPILPLGNYIFDASSEPVILGAKGQFAVSLQAVEQEEGTRITIVFGIGIGEEKPEAEAPPAGKPSPGIDPLVFEILIELEAQRKIPTAFLSGGSPSVTGFGSAGGGAAIPGGSLFTNVAVGGIEMQYDPLPPGVEIETLEQLSAREIFRQEAPSEISARLVFVLLPGPEEKGYYEMIIQDGAEAIRVPLHAGSVPIASKIVNFLKEGSRPEGQNTILFRVEIDGQIVTYVYDRQAKKVTAIVRTLPADIEREAEERERRERAPMPQMEKPELKPQEKEEEIIPILGRAPEEFPSQASFGAAALAAFFMTGLTQELSKREKETEGEEPEPPAIQDKTLPARSEVRGLTRRGFLGTTASAAAAAAASSFLSMPLGLFSAEPGKEGEIPSMAQLLKELFSRLKLNRTDREIMTFQRKVIESSRKGVRLIKIKHRKPARPDFVGPAREIFGQLGFEIRQENEFWAEDFADVLTFQMNAIGILGNAEMEKIFLTALKNAFPLAIAKIESWQIKDDAEFPMWTKSFVGGAFHIDELVVQEEIWAKINLERNRLKNVKFDTTFGIAFRVAMVQFNREMRNRATPQDPQWGPSKRYWYDPDNFLDMLGKSLNYRDLDKMSLAEMQEVYEYDQLVGGGFMDFFYSWSRTRRIRTTADVREHIEKRIGNMTDKIKQIYPHLRRPYSDFANARDIARSVFFYILSTRSLWTSEADSLETILLDDRVFRDMFFSIITRWLYLDRLPSQPVTRLYEGYDDEKLRRVNQLFRSGAFLMQPERADRPMILNFNELDFDLNKAQPEAYKLKMLLAKWQRVARTREVDREFAKWATQWSVDVSLDLDLRTLSFIRYAKEQEWAVNPLVRWLEDMRYLISSAESFTKRKLNLNKRTDFGYLSALRRSLIDNLEFSREESVLVLNLASPREKDQKVSVQIPDKAAVEVPHFNYLARNLLYRMTHNKVWDPANEKEYDLTNSEKGPVLSGAILRLVMEGIQEGNFKETEDFVKRAVGFFEDNPKREKVIEYAGRLRRAFSGKMAFTAKHLEELTLLPDDEGTGDVFGIILGLVRDYLGRAEDWRAWERTMERIVQLFEHSSREPDKFFNPMLDAFYIFQALRNNPQEFPLKDPDVPNAAKDKKFDSDFAEFRKLFLTYDPGIQGWVMSWARSLVESGFTPARRQSRGLGKQVAEILVRMGIPRATAAANTYWQAFAEAMDGTLPEITPAIVARRPQDASKTDLDILGRFLALHQRAAQEGGWLEFQQQYRLELNYFGVLKGNRAMRDRDLKSAEEFSKALYKDYRIPELTPRAVLTQRGPQSLFLGWAERQAKLVDEQLRREEAEKGKRSEIRLPKRREEPLPMDRRTFLKRGAQITAAVATGAAFTSKAFPQGINPARRRAVDDFMVVQAASGQVIPGVEGGMPQRPRPLIPLNISGVWSEELERILKDPKLREELVNDAFILEKALKNEAVDLNTPEAIEKLLASDARKEFGRVIEPNNPMTSGTIIAWGTTRIDQGWKNTEGSAVRIAQVLLDREKREIILKEAQALFDFRTAGKTIPIAEGLEQDDRAAKGLVVGWAHFRSEFEGDTNQSWEETQGMADQLVQVLNGFENDKEKGTRYFRAVAELYLLDKGLNPQNARRTAQAITSLKSFRPNKEAWSFLTGYTVALLIDVKNELAEVVEKIDPDEKLILHTQNLLFMLANKRREIQEYYAGIGRAREPLNPDHPDRTVRRRIWGEYAARLRMIEEIHGTYRLDEKIISQTLADLLTVQKAANRKWRQLEDSEAAYFYRMFYTTRFEKGQKKSYSELFKGVFSIEDFFELVTYEQGVRREAGDGLIRELKILAERGAKWPNALTRSDIDGTETEPGVLDFIEGNARKGVADSLRNQPIREGEAVQTVRYLLREQQKLSPEKWLQLDAARQKLLKETRWEMMLMSVYMLHHRDEKGFPERLNLPDLSSWVTLIRKQIYGDEEKSLATLSAFLKYDGLFIQLEKKAQASIAEEIGGNEGVEAATRFPVMDPWRRLGLVVRLHRLKKNDDWLRRYFEDLVKMQLSFYKHQNKRFIEAGLAYYSLDRFREGNDFLSSAQERRMNGYFATSANEDLIYQDLDTEGNELRRFLWDYQSIFHEVSSEEVREDGLAIARRFDELVRDLPADEREALQTELSARLQMADKNFVRAVADQVYQLAGNQFLIPYLSAARSRVKKLLTDPIRDEKNQPFNDSEGKAIGTQGPLLELIPRLTERKKKAAVIREKTKTKTNLLEPLWDKTIQERRKRKGTLPDGETEESMIQKIQARYRDYLAKPENRNKGYPAGLRRGQLLHMINSMIEQGYTLEENFLKNVELKNRVSGVYRKAYGIAEGKALTRTQEFTVSALASRIFSDWGVSLDPQRVEKGIQDELKQLEDVLIVSRQISAALNRTGKSLTDLEAYRMADNSINSGVDIGEIRVWVETARQIMAIAGEIRVRGKAVGISADQALYLADSWLKIGLAEDASFREWSEQELRGPVSSELARLGITKPEAVTAIIRRMDEREIAPVELKLLVDRALELEQSRQKVIGAERQRSLWSDREMAPQKIFELMRDLSGLDLLVYLDNVGSQPDTYLGLQEILGVSMEEIEKRIEPPVNAMGKVEVENILKAKVPAEIRNRARSRVESERARLWEEEGWGNIHTWLAGTTLIAGATFILRGLSALARNRQYALGEERMRITPRHFVYHWLNQVITLSMVFFILISLNFSFANAPSTILLWASTLYYLLLVIPDKYLLGAITAYLVEPVYRSVIAPLVKIFNPSVRPSLLHPYSGGELVQNQETGNYEIVERGPLARIPDSQKFMVSVAFPMRGESKPIADWSDINNFNVIFGDPETGHTGEAERQLAEAQAEGDSNLYYAVILQAFPKKETATEQEAREYYQQVLNLVNSRLEAMPENVRSRLYVFVRPAKLTKPITHYMLQEWMVQNDDDYVRVEPQYNVDPDYTSPGDYRFQRRAPRPADEVIDRRIPFTNVLGGNPADPSDLRNIRERNIASDADVNRRTNEVFATLVYDPGNSVTYRGILDFLSVARDPRNSNIMYIAPMDYSDKHATLHTLVMKWFPQWMLRYTWYSQAVVEQENRPPGKYLYVNIEKQVAEKDANGQLTQRTVPGFYRRVIRSRGYEKIWPFYQNLRASDDILPKSEDELMGILSGGARLVPAVTIMEDPMYHYAQEWTREITRWMFVFDQPQLMVLRIVPFIRDHPFLAALLVGFIPSFVLLGMIGTSLMTLLIGTTVSSGAALIFLGSLYNRASRIIREREASGLMAIPRLSPGEKYESDLVIRGLISELVWFIQLAVTVKAMLFPGTIEVLFPFMGEMAFISIMALLIHPKFHQTVLYLFKSLHAFADGFRVFFRTGELYREHGIRSIFYVPFYSLSYFLQAAGYLSLGLVEFVASSTIFLPKLVMKPFTLVMQLPTAMTITYFNIFGEYPKSVQLYYRYIKRQPVPTTPPRLTWNAAVVGAENPLFIEYLNIFKYPFSLMLLALTALIPGYGPISFLLGAAPFLVGISATVAVLTFVRGPMFRDYKSSAQKLSLFFIVAGTLMLASSLYPGVIPRELILRASTILIASFGFSAGWAWLFGLGFRTSNKLPQESRLIPWAVHALGASIVGMMIGATFFPIEVISVVAKFPVFSFVIPGMDGAVYMYWFSMSDQLHLPWYFVIFYTTILASSVAIGVLASIAGLIHSAFVTGGKVLPRVPALGWTGATAILLGLGRILGFGKEEAPPAVRPAATAPVVQEEKAILRGIELAQKPGEEIPPAPPVRSEVREAKKLPEFLAALDSKKEMELEQLKETAFASIREARQAGLEDKLLDQLTRFAASPEIRSRLNLGTPSEKVAMQGYYLLEYKQDYSIDFIRQLINRRPEGVEIVIFADASDEALLRATFAANLGKQFNVLSKTELESFLNTKRSELRLAASDVIHLRTQFTAELLKQGYEPGVLAGLLDAAKEGIAVASDKPIEGARELTFYDVIIQSFNETRATAKSA